MTEHNVKSKGGINYANWDIRRAQIIVTYECNKNCDFCINDELGKKRKGFVNVNDISDFMDYLSEVEQMDEAIVVLLGGEPTLMPMEDIKEICRLAHAKGYKTETYTNGLIREGLLELDGHIDSLTISNYGNGVFPYSNMSYLSDFESTEITISKLITKKDFPAFSDFDLFVDKANELPYNYDFSTVQETTVDFEQYHPEWVEEELLPLCESHPVRGSVGIALYKGRLIKLPHKHIERTGDAKALKLYPNGNLSTTWKSDASEIEYRKPRESGNERSKAKIPAKQQNSDPL